VSVTLFRLLNVPELSAYIEEYIKIIRNKCTLRRMISAAQIIEKSAVEEPENVADALDEAQSLLFKISQTSGKETGFAF